MKGVPASLGSAVNKSILSFILFDATEKSIFSFYSFIKDNSQNRTSNSLPQITPLSFSNSEQFIFYRL